MKKILYSIVGVVALLAAIAYADSLYPTSTRAIAPLTTCTNTTKLVTGTDSGSALQAITLILSCTAGPTQGVSFVSGTTLANSPIKLTNGGSVSFPSAAYPFIPAGGVYVIGDSASILFTNSPQILLK